MLLELPYILAYHVTFGDLVLKLLLTLVYVLLALSMPLTKLYIHLL